MILELKSIKIINTWYAGDGATLFLASKYTDSKIAAIGIDPVNGAVDKFLNEKGEWVLVESGSGGGHIIQSNGTDVETRTKLNFKGVLSATDNPTNGSTDIEVDLSGKANQGTSVSEITGEIVDVELAKYSDYSKTSEYSDTSDYASSAGTTQKDFYGNVIDLTYATKQENLLKANLVGGKVPSSELPSFVDDVLEVANFAALPVTGESGKIYITIDTNTSYRWSGTAYVSISNPLDYATQLEAETGTENTKVMTALRVVQSWYYQAKNYVISELNTVSKTLVGATNELHTGLSLKQTVFTGICQEQFLTENDIVIDNTSLTLTIATVKNGQIISASNPICFYTDGSGIATKHTKSAQVVFTFTNTSGIWYFYFDNSGNPIATQTNGTNFAIIATVFRLYWNATLPTADKCVIQAIEFHKNDISWTDHAWKHAQGTQYVNGFDISSNKLASGAPNANGSNSVISISSGTNIDDNLSYTVTNAQTGTTKFTQDLGTALLPATSAKLICISNDAAGLLTKLPATAYPFLFNATTNLPEYLTVSGVRTPVGSGNFFVYYVYALQDPRRGETIKIKSAETDFANTNNASAHNWEQLQAVFPTLRDNEIRLMYKIVFEYRTSYDIACKKTVIRNIDDLRKQKITTTSLAGGTLPATSVTFAPIGNLSSTNVQNVIQELDDEKLSVVSHNLTLTGDGGIAPLGITESYLGAYKNVPNQEFLTGSIYSADRIYGGSGYAVNDTVNVISPLLGVGGQLTIASIMNGSISNAAGQLTLNNGGSGYSVGQILTLTTTGTGATVRILTVNAGAVLTWEFITYGLNYVVGTTVTTVLPAGGTGCIFNIVSVRNGSAATFTVLAAGSLYVENSTGLATTNIIGTGSGLLATIKTSVALQLAANSKYEMIKPLQGRLTLTIPTLTALDAKTNDFQLMFTSGNVAPTIVWPANMNFTGGYLPTILPNRIYLFNFLLENKLVTNLFPNSSVFASGTKIAIYILAGTYTLSFYGYANVDITGAYTGNLTGDALGNQYVKILTIPSSGIIVFSNTGSNANSVQLEPGAIASQYVENAGYASTSALKQVLKGNYIPY